MEPTKIRTQPVAHGGMEAKIGAKKMLIKKQIPAIIARDKKSQYLLIL